jgi:hypothetical protein
MGTWQSPLCGLGGEQKNPGHHVHGNGHFHVQVYAQLKHIKDKKIKAAMHGPH